MTPYGVWVISWNGNASREAIYLPLVRKYILDMVQNLQDHPLPGGT